MCHNLKKVTSNGRVTCTSQSAYLKSTNSCFILLERASSGKKESKRLDLVQMCTNVGCNFSEHPFLGKRYPCPSVLRNGEIKNMSNTARNQCNHVSSRIKSYVFAPVSLSVRAIVSTLEKGVGRGKGLQATCVSLFFMQATCSANLNSLIGIVYSPCFVFRNENCPGGPGGKSGSPPGAKLWAPNPRWSHT